MLESKGLKLAASGVLAFILGALTLLVLEGTARYVSVVVMLGGGMCVWIGFLWTLFGYYSAPPPPGAD